MNSLLMIAALSFGLIGADRVPAVVNADSTSGCCATACCDKPCCGADGCSCSDCAACCGCCK